MTKNPWLNAGAAIAYIALVALFLFYGQQVFGKIDGPLAPLAMISLFTLSAALMGYLFLLKPLALYLDGQKAEAIKLFTQTVAIFALLTVIVFIALYFSVGRMKTAIFNCPDGQSITARFYLDNDKQVDLKLSDGRSFSLPRAISASGARYANVDESIVFWNKGDSAFITEGEKTTFADCVTK